jgi:hypothetical protein
LLVAVLAEMKVKSGDSFTVRASGPAVDMKQGKSDGPVIFAIDKTKASALPLYLRASFNLFV